jgi:hypothetical protein
LAASAVALASEIFARLSASPVSAIAAMMSASPIGILQAEEFSKN